MTYSFLPRLLFTALFAATLAPPAKAAAFLSPPAYETVHLGGAILVREGETQSLPLGGARYIKNLVLQARGLSADSTVEVMVNGQLKGTIYVPGRDPSYLVTISETARSIEFRHRSGGSMRIDDVLGTVSDWMAPIHSHEGGFSGSLDEVQRLALSALNQLDGLAEFANPEEQAIYLFPIKRNAGLVYVMASAHGDLSRKTIQQLEALEDQIDFANSYLTQLMQRDGAFDLVVDLLTVREKINALLQ